MNERSGFLTAIAAEPGDDVRQLAFADFLQEHGEEERAEQIRYQMRLVFLNGLGDDDDIHATYVAERDHCRARLHDIEARLSAWPCGACGGDGKWTWTTGNGTIGDPCPACGGSCDVLRTQAYPAGHRSRGVLEQLPLRWRGGYPVSVELPRLADAVEQVRCNGIRHIWPIDSGTWTEEPDCRTCSRTGQKWQPTPRLVALAGNPPWGVPLEAVTVGNREPMASVVHSGKYCWVETTQLEEPQIIPKCIHFLLDPYNANPYYPTPESAKFALGRALLTFARKH